MAHPTNNDLTYAGDPTKNYFRPTLAPLWTGEGWSSYSLAHTIFTLKRDSLTVSLTTAAVTSCTSSSS